MKESQFVFMMVCILILGGLFSLVTFAYMVFYSGGFWMWFSLVSCVGWGFAITLFLELIELKQEQEEK